MKYFILIALIPYWTINTSKELPKKCACINGLPNSYCPAMITACGPENGPVPIEWHGPAIK